MRSITVALSRLALTLALPCKDLQMVLESVAQTFVDVGTAYDERIDLLQVDLSMAGTGECGGESGTPFTKTTILNHRDILRFNQKIRSAQGKL
mmetsp:Transcript_2964/g.5270  ORF Transcript_2964/g.5270 Transcript_2964/m.5270 type:complete len:93 (+) Transcript_2964:149-427(+)